MNYSNGLKARLISQLSLGRTEPVLSLALSPNFKLLAIGGKHQIWIWNTTNGKVVQSVFASATNSDEKGAVSLSWSPDGKQLAAGGLHGIIMVWQINPQTNLLRNGPLRIEPDQDSATWGEEVNVAFSPDGSSLGAIDDKGSIIEWDSQTFSLKMIYDTSYAGHFAWAADGKSIIDDLMDIGYVGDTKFYEPGVDIQKCDNTPYNISWSPDGSKIGLSSQDCELSLMEAPKSGSNTGVTTIMGVSETAKDNGNNSQRRPMSWSPDSHLIAVGNIPTIGKISMWEANSTKNIMTFDTGNKEITAVTWFSTSILITGGLDGEIKFWEIK